MRAIVVISISASLLLSSAGHGQDRGSYNTESGAFSHRRTYTNIGNGEVTQTVCQGDLARDGIGRVCKTNTWQVPPPDPPPSPSLNLPWRRSKAAAEEAERDRKWTERCKPQIVTGRDGISRYRYAAPNCDAEMVSR